MLHAGRLLTGQHHRDAVDTLLQRRADIACQEEVLLHKLHELRRSTLDIDELLNARLPVNSLPVEVLVDIFALVQAEPPRYDYGKNSYRITWLPILAVCRHWRRVMCSNPGFWRTIEVTSTHEWLRISLERCAHVHADVTLRDNDLNHDIWPVLAKGASTIRSLTIRHLELSWRMSVIALLVEHQWPVLQRLDIESGLRFSPLRDNLPAVDIILTTESFPSLRSLCLRSDGFCPPTERSLYRHLRTLDLRSCVWAMPLGQFLDVLESMTHVEILHLHKVSWHMAEVPDNLQARVVSLSCLRSLTLESCSYLPTTCILNCLRLPAVTFISLSICISDEDPQGIIAAIPQDRSAVFPMLSAITSAEVSAEHDSGGVYGLRGTNAANSHTAAIQLDTSEYVADDWPFSLSRALADFVNVFSHSPITALAVSGEYSMVSVTNWVDVFAHFPNLERIDLRLEEPESTHTFWMALSQTPSTSHHGAVYCPRLRTVRTIGSHCVVSMGESAFWAMPRALRTRKDRGHSLEKLEINSGSEGDDDCLGKENTAYLAQVEACVEGLVIGLLDESGKNYEVGVLGGMPVFPKTGY
ncbi:hypothetical protein K466DRAFT_510726 [Polyporus arcularius HHB13444]|uniref:F-box domain-containing protein n=1 Tax=Polyporus arcularius HHB13444 TaxID=1314778 RepID=A0A5C3PYH2_9APHY|nr:hypothetical protein K466DRAFT_510726 [Polyporus arcularius HHB13444]